CSSDLTPLFPAIIDPIVQHSQSLDRKPEAALTPRTQPLQLLDQTNYIVEASILQQWTEILEETRPICMHLFKALKLLSHACAQTQTGMRGEYLVTLSTWYNNLLTELVSVLQPFDTCISIFQSEHKSPPISVTSTPSVPIHIRKSRRDLPILSQTAQHGIDRLPLRSNNTHLYWPVLDSKNLRTQHRRVSDPEQLLLSSSRIVLCDDEEPRTIRRAMNMRRLYQSVQSLLLNRKHVKVSFGCRSHRLHKIFQWIMVDPAPKIK